MEEVDHAMQAEIASQAGSVAHSDKMELEQEDQLTVRDAEMEIHDIEAEGTIDDMKAAIADDADMNAEMLEQEHMQAERDWKDFDAEVDVLPLDDPPAEHAGSQTPTSHVHPPESEDVQPLEQLEDPTSLGNGITDSDITDSKAAEGTEEGQQAMEQSLDGRGEASTAVPGEAETVESKVNEDAEKLLQNAGPEQAHKTEDSASATKNFNGLGNRDSLANALLNGTSSVAVYGESYAGDREPVASTSAVRVEDYVQAPTFSQIPGYRFPPLQKHYLAHVEVFPGEPPMLTNGSGGRAAPHVSLLYNNDTFSLFRPSSIPSGDDEKVIFEADEDQHLYYSSLYNLIGKLHEAFPHFRGDGDNELILDFGILDMQISEDNVYTEQLSLHDVDRIRVGMCQPELDRLQITLLTGKRFVYKFNELAEHVYRMYAGSEYDSGTVYDETVEEEEVPEDIPEYYDEGAAEEDAFQTAEEAQAVVTGDDLVHGDQVNETVGTGDLIQPTVNTTEEPIAYPEDKEEAGEQGEEPTQEELYETDRADADAGEEEEHENPGANSELHPPSDEYYEDPEFSQHPVEAEGAYEEQYDDEEDGEAAEGDSETVRDYTEHEPENGLPDEEEVQEVLTLDPDAPLDEVAEQIEHFEESTLEREEDAAAEAQAARHDEPVVSTTSVNVEAVDKDTERIYAGMDSLAAEEQGKVDAHSEPVSSIAPDLPITKPNGAGKRTRDDVDENDDPSAPNGIGAEAAQGVDEQSKRPRVSPDA